MKKLDNYEVYSEIEKHAKNGGIIYAVLNDNYTPAVMIYDYILYDRATKGATIYKYIVRGGRTYTERKYNRIPQNWGNKTCFVGCYGDTSQDGYINDYKELYSDLCE